MTPLSLNTPISEFIPSFLPLSMVMKLFTLFNELFTARAVLKRKSPFKGAAKLLVARAVLYIVMVHVQVCLRE